MKLSHEEKLVLGNNIVRGRRRKGMTQEQLAQAVADRGGNIIEGESVRRSLVNWEKGKFAPRLRTLETIATILEQPLSFFVPAPEVAEDTAPFRSAA